MLDNAHTQFDHTHTELLTRICKTADASRSFLHGTLDQLDPRTRTEGSLVDNVVIAIHLTKEQVVLLEECVQAARDTTFSREVSRRLYDIIDIRRREIGIQRSAQADRDQSQLDRFFRPWLDPALRT